MLNIGRFVGAVIEWNADVTVDNHEVVSWDEEGLLQHLIVGEDDKDTLLEFPRLDCEVRSYNTKRV